MPKIDLNCDLGESFGIYKLGLDEQVIPYITSANIACGFHAGDPIVMGKTVDLAKKAGIGIGAHPGFLDLMGFGRRNIQVSPKEVKAFMLYQIGALDAFCRANGTALTHVKPHGALYNMAAKDKFLAKAICEAILDYDPTIILLALSGSVMSSTAKEYGIAAANEVFADRAYEEDGSLVARTKPGAMIENEDLAVERVVRMIMDKKVRAITGKDIDIEAQSICVHGDSSKALDFVKKIRNALNEAGIELSPLSLVMERECG